MSAEARDYDVAIVGGAFAGAAMAIILREADPGLRVIVIDSTVAFGRKVGESAIELSSWFLMRVLGLDRHLAVEQLPKYGLRFWFHNDKVTTLSEASELGSFYQPRVPGWHFDRAILDEHMLDRARCGGADLARPARVTGITLARGGASTLEIEGVSGRSTVTARWVVDATGRKAWLGRKLGLIEKVPEHPTRAIWARYRGTRDFDGPWLAPIRTGGRAAVACSRGLATNHFSGPGFWTWVIPLPGGDTSVGLVWDDRICKLPPGESPAERFESFMKAFPAGRELLEGAERVKDDVHALNGLPYRATRQMGDGWALVGDAAGFLDPFYSPGLDWSCCTIVKASRVILDSLSGADPAEAIRKHNRDFTASYTRWLEAIYLDKYYYMGDADLMGIALRIEVPLYYLGIVWPAYRKGMEGIEAPFALGPALPFHMFMRFMNRRLASLGKIRMRAGSWGRNNAGRHDLLPGFKLGLGDLKYVPSALARLAWLEIASIPDRLRARWRPGRLASAPAPGSDITR
jgi:flavin-dependent dehydrogenase